MVCTEDIMMIIINILVYSPWEKRSVVSSLLVPLAVVVVAHHVHIVLKVSYQYGHFKLIYLKFLHPSLST